MIRFKRLLALTDFSADANNAVRRMAMLAAAGEARLEIQHVLPDSALQVLQEILGTDPARDAQLEHEATSQLQALAEKVKQDCGIEANTNLQVGNVLREALEAMQDHDLVALGAHGNRKIRDMLIGSLPLRLIGKSRQPILVVNRPPEHPYRRILVPVDFSPHGKKALDTALALSPDAKICVAHAFEVPFEGKLMLAGAGEEELRRYRAKAQESALRKMRELLDDVSVSQATRIVHYVEQADPAIFILEQAQDFQADLIVIGKHGQSLVEEMLLGSVTRHVLADAECDVLVTQA